MAILSSLSIAATGQFPQAAPYHLLRELTLDYSGTLAMIVVPAAYEKADGTWPMGKVSASAE